MKVIIGFATKFGAFLAGLSYLIPLIGEFFDTAAPLGMASSKWVENGTTIALVVIGGRMIQAVGQDILNRFILDDTASSSDNHGDLGDDPIEAPVEKATV